MEMRFQDYEKFNFLCLADATKFIQCTEYILYKAFSGDALKIYATIFIQHQSLKNEFDTTNFTQCNK